MRVGFDIGGTNIRGIALDDAGEVIATGRLKRPAENEDLSLIHI